MYQNVIQHLDTLMEKLNTTILKKIDVYKLTLEHLKSSYIFKNPNSLYEEQKEDLYVLNYRLYQSMKNVVIIEKNNLNNVINKLTLLNPLTILDRGYNIAYKDNEIVKTVSSIQVNDNLKIKMCDGELMVRVNEVKKNGTKI